jgi:hypothetical protein
MVISPVTSYFEAVAGVPPLAGRQFFFVKLWRVSQTMSILK